MSSSTAAVPRPPEGFDPTSQEFLADPESMLKRMRDECPVFYWPEHDFWGVTRYEDIVRVLHDFESFSQGAIRTPPIPEAFRDKIPERFFSTAFTVLDPPEHTPYRKAGQSVLTRGRVERLRDPIRGIAHDLIDGFVDDGACDLMDRFCYALTISSIMLLLGLPVSEQQRLRQFVYDWAVIVQEAIIPMPEEEREARWGHHAAVREWFGEVIARRLQEPGDDVISELAGIVGADGEAMFDAQRLATHMNEFLFGGTDTAANTMASAVMHLERHPDVRERFLADPAALAPRVVEETLRVSAPMVGIWKQATRDAVVGDVTIPAGAAVWVMLYSAGHDACRFADPDRFDVDRPNSSDHLTFGLGRHFCLGAPLARAEAAIGLQALYERLPGLRLAPDAVLEYEPTTMVRFLERLPVVWDVP